MVASRRAAPFFDSFPVGILERQGVVEAAIGMIDDSPGRLAIGFKMWLG
jgi:hypothetical protein